MKPESYRIASETTADAEIELLLVQRHLSQRIVRVSVAVASGALLASTVLLYVYFSEQFASRRRVEWPNGAAITAILCSSGWVGAVAALVHRYIVPRYRRQVLTRHCQERGLSLTNFDHLLF